MKILTEKEQFKKLLIKKLVRLAGFLIAGGTTTCLATFIGVIGYAVFNGVPPPINSAFGITVLCGLTAMVTGLLLLVLETILEDLL